MKRYFPYTLISFLLLLFIINSSTKAQIPRLINYQASLMDAENKPYNGYELITFAIFADEYAGVIPLWAETRSVDIVNGFVNVYLGEVAPINLPFDRTYWLEVKLSNSPHFPRTRLSSVPYSFMSLRAQSADTSKISQSIIDNGIKQNMLDPSVKALPWGPASGFLSGNYPNPSINIDSLNKFIALGFIRLNQNAGGDLTGQYPNPIIKDDAINAEKIQDGAVTNSKIEFNSITQDKLTLNAVNVDNIDAHQHIGGLLAPIASSIMYDGTKVYWGNPSPGGGAGGDLTGLFPSPHVVGLRGIPISDYPSLKDNEVYVFRNYGTSTNDDDKWISQKIKPENLFTFSDSALGISENGYVLTWYWNGGTDPRMKWINFNSQLLNTAYPIVGNGEPSNPITLNIAGISPYEMYYLSPTTGSWTNGKLMPEHFIANPSSPGAFEDGYVLSWNNSSTIMEWIQPTVKTSMPVIGDGSVGNELRLNTTGVLANDVLYYDGADWLYSKVQTPMIADLAVTTTKVADKNITVGKINNGANDNILVTTGGNAVWQNLNLSATFTGNGVSIPIGIAAAAISATELADASVTNAKLGLLSVATSNIQDNAVTIAKINPGVSNSVLLTNSSGTSATWSSITASNMTAGDYTSVITSGSYTIDIAGNAGTVTNGVYTTGSYADPAWITSLSGSKITGAMTGTTIGFDDVTSATNLGQALLIGNGSTLGPTGTGVITANAITAGTYGININGNAATATSLAGNLAGDLPYQSAPGTTSFLGIAANNNVLISNGTVPTWGMLSASNMSAGNYSSVMTSGSYTIDIAGNAGTVTNGVYTTGSYSDPSWITSLSGSKITGAMTGTTIGFDDVTSATNLGQALLIGNGSILGPTGTGTITANAITAGTYGISITGNAGTATSLAGNLAGDLPYQSAPGTTSFLNIAANNNVLISNGTSPTWGMLSASNMTAGDYSSVFTSGSYTINIAGNAGTVTNGVYTTGSYADPSWITSLSGSKITGAMTGTTIGFDDVTSATNLGQALLVGNGSTFGPTGTGVITANAISAGTYGINISGNAATATSLAGNLAGDLPYQSAPGTTSFLNIAANNNVLISNGTAPTWGMLTASNMTAGDYTSVITSGSYTIDIAGNAGTVTYGVYTTGSYADPSWITSLSGSKITGAMTGTTIGFDDVTSATNLGQALLVGNGSTLGPTGTGVITANAITAGTYGINISGNAATATSLAGNVAGDLPYQSAPATTSFLGIAANNNVLISNGTAPTWGMLTASNMTAGDYTSVITSGSYTIDIAGNAGTVTNGVYTTGSYADPSWITSLSGSKITGAMTGTTIGFDDVTSATNLGQALLIGNGSTLGTTGTGVITANAISAGTYGISITGNAATATSLAGNLAGDLPYQSAPGTTSFLNIGANNTILKSNGTVPSWGTISASNMSAGDYTSVITSGSYTIDIAGNAGTVTNGVYTTGSYADPSWITSLSGSKITGAMTGTTIGFDDVTSATNLGQALLIGNGSTFGPTGTGVITANAITAGTYGISITGNAATATSLAGNLGGDLPYQSAPGTTAFLNIGANNTILKSNGTVPSWGTISASNMSAGDYTSVITSGSYTIDISGNAGTVTNGVYTTGSYSDPSWITSLSGSKITGAMTGTTIGFDDVTSATNLGQALLIGNGSTLGPTGTGVITANAISAGTYGISVTGNAATATSLAGNLAGDLPYQSAPGTTSFLNIAANNNVLISNGTAPTWGMLTASNMTAGDYSSVFTSGSYTINIAGNAGTVTNGVYTTGSYADPSWITSLDASKITGSLSILTIGFDNVTSATNLGQSLLVGNGSTLGPTGTGTITANAISAGTYGINISGNAGTSTSLAGNLAGDLPYQSAPGTTSFLNIAANNNVLISNGTFPTWGMLSASNMTAGDYSSVMTSGSYTINIAGNAGTVTNGVYSTGSYADPAWITTLSGTKVSGSISGNAGTATSLAGNLAGDLPYQTAPGTTSFLGIAANNNVLISNGTSPTWGMLSASNMSAGDYSSVMTSGSYTINIAGNAGTASKVNNTITNGAGISSLSFDGSASQSVAIDYTAAGTWAGLQTFNSPGVDINAGNIDGTTIGGTAPAAGSFTSVTVSSSVASPGKVLTLDNTGTGIAASITDNGGGVKLGYGTGTIVTDAVTIDGDRNSVYYVTSDNNSTNDVITVSNGINGQIVYVVYYRSAGTDQVTVSGASAALAPGANGFVGITLVYVNGVWRTSGSHSY